MENYLTVAFAHKGVVIATANMIQLPRKSEVVLITDLPEGQQAWSVVSLMWHIGFKDDDGLYETGMDADVVISVEPVGRKSEVDTPIP